LYIPPETIDLIRDKVVIQDIIKKYVPSLKRKGKNFIGLCPFHKEKTPSFTVSPDKQIFYCFGCHEGGNIFSFISKAERLDFPDSVKFVAEHVGVQIGEEKKGDSGIREAIYELNARVMDMYHRHIRSAAGRPGYEYVIGRGVTDTSIGDFAIGYAPDSWNFLAGSIIKSRMEQDIAASIGLIKARQGSSGEYYDMFRNRIMFPIIDTRGAVVAFGGRALGDDPRKYINSPESAVFKKRAALYGLNRALESIRDTKRAIVVEGYLDVIGCHQAGICNVVAPMGTAVTGEQIALLGRYCMEIIFLFDADSAGINAAVRSIDVTKESNVSVKIGMLAEGDPFDFIHAHGGRAFMAVVDSALKPVDFRIVYIMKNNTDRVRTMLQLFGVIRDLKLETERSIYIKKISSMLGFDEKSVRTDFKKYLDDSGRPAVTHIPVERNERSEIITRSYQDLIKLICHYPDLIQKAVIDYNLNEIPDQVSRNILKKFSELYSEDKGFTADKIFDFFTSGPEAALLRQVFGNEYPVQNPTAVYTEIYINMKLRDIDDKLERYYALIQSPPAGSSDKYITDIQIEIEVLSRERDKLKNYIYNKFS
jgi:DNA primase